MLKPCRNAKVQRAPASAVNVLVVDDCRAAYERLSASGVEFMQEPVDRYGTVDAGFRDPSGNGWKMIQARKS